MQKLKNIVIKSNKKTLNKKVIKLQRTLDQFINSQKLEHQRINKDFELYNHQLKKNTLSVESIENHLNKKNWLLTEPIIFSIKRKFHEYKKKYDIEKIQDFLFALFMISVIVPLLLVFYKMMYCIIFE
jgi:hypothetical protein